MLATRIIVHVDRTDIGVQRGLYFDDDQIERLAQIASGIDVLHDAPQDFQHGTALNRRRNGSHQRRDTRWERDTVGRGERTSSRDALVGDSSTGVAGAVSNSLNRRAETTMRVITGC